MILDNFLPNPCRVRRQALRSEFIDWDGPDGETYKRICITDVPGLVEALEKAVGPVEMLGMGYRLNYAGEPPNAAIHSDLGWGTHALVLYLCDGPGGTAFWQHKDTGACRIDEGDAELFTQVRGDWNDASKWDQRGVAEMRFNRAVVYESALFHSRWPLEAFGTDPQTGRLIAVAFFNLGH